MRDGQGAEARKRFDEARKRAMALGFAYQPIGQLASGRIDNLLERGELLIASKKVEDELEVAALLGGEEPVSLTGSQQLAEYEGMKKAELAVKSPNQGPKWKNPRLHVINTFIDLIGDKAIDKTTRTDTVRYRNWWAVRIVDKDLEVATANKNIGLISRMYRDFNKVNQLNLTPIFADLRIEGEIDRQRAAFAADLVETATRRPGQGARCIDGSAHSSIAWTAENVRLIYGWQVLPGKYSDKTLNAHLADIRRFEAFTDRKTFTEIMPPQAASYRDRLIQGYRHSVGNERLSASTFRHATSYLRSFFDWLEARGRKAVRPLNSGYFTLPKALHQSIAPVKRRTTRRWVLRCRQRRACAGIALFSGVSGRYSAWPRSVPCGKVP